MWGGALTRPLLARRQLLFYAGLTRGGSDSRNKHASPDCQISVVVRASRNIRSARAGGHGCASARLLSAQRRASMPRLDRTGIRASRHPRRQLLQSRLLPCGNHISVGAPAAVAGFTSRAASRSANHRIVPRNSRHANLRIAIHPRPSASLHRLNAQAKLPALICTRVGPDL